MISLFYKLKRNKLLFALVISLFVILLLDIALIIFDIIEIVKTGSNSAVLVGGFLGFNIFVFAINVVGLIFVAFYLIPRRIKINKVLDKNK